MRKLLLAALIAAGCGSSSNPPAEQQQVASPTFSVPAGTYASAQTVTLSSATAGATIRYTEDGSTPTASSPTCTGPVVVSSTRTLKAFASAPGMKDSAIASAVYTIQGGGGSVQLVISGTVSTGDGQSQPTASAGVDVQVAVSGAAVATATTGSDGSYTANADVPAGANVVVSFKTTGYAPLYRTVKADASASLTVNASLRALGELTCSGARCALDNGKLSLAGLPAGTTGSGRVFNPVTESSAFPGSFSDSAGNLLVSGVFAVVDLSQDGVPVSALAPGAPAQLDMEVPRDTWPVVTDIDPATTDRIEVPLYYFDEEAGTWVRQGQAVLVTADGGFVNATTELAALRAGTFGGPVYARGSVQHFSYWNVDWPIESHACLTAKVITAGGQVAAGATVSVSGVSYNGTTTPQAVGADGRFCADVMRSDPEPQSVKIAVAHAGEVYSFGPFQTPAAQGSCGQPGCVDLGELKLTEDRKLAVVACTITGTAVDRANQPLGGALVYGWDDSVPEAVRDAQCQSDFELCLGMTTSAADGTFSLRMLAMGAPTIGVWFVGTTDPAVARWRFGQRDLQGCPAQAVTLVAEDGIDWLNDIGLALTAETLSWSASYRATMLYASAGDTMYSTKWLIDEAVQGLGFAGPVTYGVVPADAQQAFPLGGAPAPLAAGDRLGVYVSGRGTTGYSYFGSGVCSYDTAVCGRP